MEKLAISPNELAKSLGIGKSHTFKLIHTAGFPHIKLGKRIIIPIQPLQEWLKENLGKEVHFSL